MPNLAKRLLTAAVLVPILLAINYWAPWWAFPGLVAVAAALAASEYYAIMAVTQRRLRLLGPLSSTVIVAALSLVPGLGQAQADLPLWPTVLAYVGLAPLLLLLARPGDMKQVPELAGTLTLGLVYTALLPAFVALLHRVDHHGPDLIVLALTVSFLGDTGAYFAGRAFGKHRLYPAVSPKKTWEGAVGGLVASTLAGLVAHLWYLPELPLVPGLVVCGAAGAVGQCGDLCESMLKRARGVKDSGALLPGHGGLLDRIDALLFVAPVLYLSIHWLGLLDN